MTGRTAPRAAEFHFTIDKPHLWNGREDPFLYKAVLHITSKAIDVRRRKTFIKLYSNCESVALYINDKFYKEIRADKNKQKCIYIFKSVKLKKGKNAITAIGKSKGKEYTDSAVFTVR